MATLNETMPPLLVFTSPGKGEVNAIARRVGVFIGKRPSWRPLPDPPLSGEGARKSADRHRHEVRVVGALHAHQHVVLALRLRIGKRLAQIAGVADALAGDVENDVAGLQAVLGGRTSGSTPVTTTPLPPAPATLLAGATVRPRCGAPRWHRRCLVVGAGLLLVRHRRQRHADGLLLTLAQ